VSTAQQREKGRGEPRRFKGRAAGGGRGSDVTFVDLGSGTGAAARAVLDLYPGATAVLADYSEQMIEQGRRASAGASMTSTLGLAPLARGSRRARMWRSGSARTSSVTAAGYMSRLRLVPAPISRTRPCSGDRSSRRHWDSYA
jgi:hypothetical protein